MRKRLWVALAAAACVFAALIVLLCLPARTPQAGDRLLAAAEELDTITIDAAFNPGSQSLSVSQTFTLQNRTGEDQTELVLRTYAAAFRDEEYAPSATEELHSACYPAGFSAGGLEIEAGMLSYTYADDARTVMVVALGSVWPGGETLTLHLDYTLTIPTAAYRFGMDNGVYALGNAFIVPAVYANGAWRTEEYYSIGTPFISDCRNYTVTLTLPEGYTAAGSGTAVTNGRTTTFTALASRDFAMCISREYHRSETVQDGVLIEAYGKTASSAKAMLSVAKQAMRTYADLYGSYPYPSVTLAEASLPFDDASYPSFTMIASDVLAMDSEPREIRIARALALQWFAEVIGTDGYDQAWQREALAEYALLRYWEERHGAAARDNLQFSRVDTAMLISVSDLTPGSPLDYFYHWDEYRTVVWHQRRGGPVRAGNRAGWQT